MMKIRVMVMVVMVGYAEGGHGENNVDKGDKNDCGDDRNSIGDEDDGGNC